MSHSRKFRLFSKLRNLRSFLKSFLLPSPPTSTLSHSTSPWFTKRSSTTISTDSKSYQEDAYIEFLTSPARRDTVKKQVCKIQRLPAHFIERIKTARRNVENRRLNDLKPSFEKPVQRKRLKRRTNPVKSYPFWLEF